MGEEGEERGEGEEDGGGGGNLCNRYFSYKLLRFKSHLHF